MAESLDLNFPIWGLLPKKETGVTQFLAKYPFYDGRGTIIAIFDSGVDPGAPGLQVTSDGKPKIVERFDCSGHGDVDTSKTIKTIDGYLIGITGRRLKIPSTWNNPSGVFHLGVKSAYSLYPNKLRERIEATRKKNFWDEGNKRALVEATRILQEFENKHVQITTIEEKLIKEDLEARVEYLTNLEKKYKDVGPSYDCVVFHDGQMWRACIDTSENGDLASGVYLGEYTFTKEYAPLTQDDQLNITINVHDDGNTLEVVSLCSPHGTHVASIAAGHFPDNKELNGIAPGAQIISLTIGDARLNTMETGSAVVRAIIKVMSYKDKVHVINMSYGERTHWSNAGRIGELMNEVSDKFGVTWVTSAGNQGPALCTINTPPDINSNSIIGVGAYVSPDMMLAEYSLREKLPGMPYTWSSRGPLVDGGLGVSVCAPGGAITSVPNFTLRKCQLLNGTSMASPHVAGAVAILVSGLIEKKLQFSPYSIKRALENTAQFVCTLDPFAQGAGLVQVERAFENLLATANSPERDIRFSINCGPNNAKGIHLRTGAIDRAKDYAITVEPIFMDTDSIDPTRKIDFNMKLTMVCDAAWIHFPTHFNLMHMSRAFAIRVDATALEEGAHFTSIRAFDITNVDKGPVFRIPITVVQPSLTSKIALLPDFTFTNVQFKPNTIRRHFIVVPDDATWAVLRLKTSERDKTGRFVIHAVQLKPRLSTKTLEFNKMVNITSQSETVQGFSVQGGLILEVAIAKYWANLGDIIVDYTMEFHGVRLINGDLTMQSGDGIHRLELRSSLRNEEIAPNIVLKHFVQVLRPIDFKIRPLRARDVIPPARQIFELLLTYTFHIAKPTEIMPNATLMSELLYENEYESQLWMIYNSNKQLLHCGDAYPTKYIFPKIDKGDYSLKMQIRHEKRDLLERLTEMPLLLMQKLGKEINLDIYASHLQALTGGKKMISASIPPGHILPLYVAPLANENKLAKGATLGAYLQGVITFCKDEIGKRVDTHVFKFSLSEPTKRSIAQNNENEKDKTKWDEFNEALRDLKCHWLAKLQPGECAKELYNELRAEYPEYCAVHTAMLSSLESSDAPRILPYDELSESTLHFASEIIAVADELLKLIDQNQLLEFYGLKCDQRPDAQKIKNTMDKQRTWLLEALVKKGCALSRIYVQAKRKNEPNETMESLISKIDQIWNEAQKFAEFNDLKLINLSLWHAHVNKHYGRYLKLLVRYYDDKPIKEIDEKFIEIAKILGWNYLAQHINTSIPIKYPHAHISF